MKSVPIFLFAIAAIFMMSCGSSKKSSNRMNHNNSVEQMANHQTTQMSERLRLTPAQELEVNAINLKYAKKMKMITQEGRNRSTMNTLKNMNEEKNVEMKKVLSKEQFVNYRKMLDEMKGNRARRRG